MLTFRRPGKKVINPFPANNKSDFVNMFEFMGTADNAAFLCIADALKWRESLGGEAAIRDYCTDLSQRASSRVAEILGTEYIENDEGTLRQCFMSNVNLPLKLSEVKKIAERAGAKIDDVGLQYKVRDWLTLKFVNEHNTFMALGIYNGGWFVRLSATVYLDMDDFEWAARVLQSECELVKRGEFLDRPETERTKGSSKL
jgi:hercynylcysteine S-oxide lyase